MGMIVPHLMEIVKHIHAYYVNWSHWPQHSWIICERAFTYFLALLTYFFQKCTCEIVCLRFILPFRSIH